MQGISWCTSKKYPCDNRRDTGYSKFCQQIDKTRVPSLKLTLKGCAWASRAWSPRSLAADTIFIDCVILEMFFVALMRIMTCFSVAIPRAATLLSTNNQQEGFHALRFHHVNANMIPGML